ncbi:THO complex subunit 6 homolog [Tubulanus polymorphus]|uniref:THO complex subunit 6 homolog n=1 Tax=Tubulanus polymorphus TaxID=672921 RepID=UPI003DA25923
MDQKLTVQQLYTSVYDQCYSPCGKYLAACNNFGKIAVFNISAALSPEGNEQNWRPVFKFTAHDGPVYTLVSTDRFLISAGTGDIKAWIWTDIIRADNFHKTPNVAWCLSVPGESRFEHPEVNSLVLDNKNGTNSLFGAGGDGNVYMWDLESGKLQNTFRGHTDYIHSLTLRKSSNECLSASEDGTVRVWDVRIPQEAAHVIEPYKTERCNRPHLGKWIGCIAMDSADDWMVCGGGPNLSLWYMRSLAPTTVFTGSNACHQFVKFHEDTIISGGNENLVTHWNISGTLKSQVPCSSNSVYKVCVNDKSDSCKVLSVSGNSANIDIFTNFGYKAFSLCF